MKTITPKELFLKIVEGAPTTATWAKNSIKLIEEAKIQWENEAILQSLDEHLEEIL